MCGIELLQLMEVGVVQFAVYAGHLDIIQYLIERGADVHIDGNYILSNAANNGIDIHMKDDLASRMATLKGDLETVKWLVETGADIHVKYDYVTKQAIRKNRDEVVKYLK